LYPNRHESTEDAKYVAVDFFNDVMKQDIEYEDIDCSHRVGKVENKKQTLLVRLYSRELVESLLRKKKELKGKPYVLYEDATMVNRVIVNTIKRMPLIENAWIINGTIWAKKVGGEKFKVGIHDNLATLIANH
jgi:hypothetical protein